MPCDPQTLQTNATCTQRCIPDGRVVPVLIYLAALRAGVSTDPSVLANNARCLSSRCIPVGLQLPILISLAGTISGDPSLSQNVADRAVCISSCVMPGFYWRVILNLFCTQSGVVADCTSQTVVNNANCIACGMPEGMQLPVLIYLFAVIAGVSTDAQSLANRANCILCGIHPGLELPALIGLVCDFFLTPSGPSAPTNPDIDNNNPGSDDSIISWDQSSAPDTNEIWRSQNFGAYVLWNTVAGGVTTITDTNPFSVGIYTSYKIRATTGGVSSAFTSPVSVAQSLLASGITSHPDLIYIYGALSGDTTVTSVSLPALKFANSIELGGESNLVSASFGSLTTIGTIGGAFDFNGDVLLSTLSAPVLSFLGGMNIVTTALTSLSLPQLASSLGAINVLSNSSLVSVSFPVLSGLSTESLEISNNPALTSINLNSFTGPGIDLIISTNATLPSLSLPALIATPGAFNASSNPMLASLSAPSLQSVGTDLVIFTNTALSSISFPALTSVGLAVNISNNNAITSFSCAALATIGDTITGTSCPLLTSISLPSLTTIPADVNFNACTLLATVSIPVVIFNDGILIGFTNDALNAASVNLILRRGVVSGNTSADFELAGGTNAGTSALSGQGTLDYNALILAGNTVNLNP